MERRKLESTVLRSGVARTESQVLDELRFEFGVTPFYFLRHGETRETERGIVQGQNDTRLIAKGRQSAVKAAGALDGVLLRSIYASPLKRAWETASILSILRGVPVFPAPGLMERNWGPYQGLHKELRPSDPSAGTVESREAFAKRVIAAMRSISGPSPLVVVAHSGVFRVLCGHLGHSDDPAVTVPSGLVVRFEPPRDRRQGWHLSAVG
jgi:probable phosphoglycerate mutase